MIKDMVSVIIPYYNRKDYLEECVKSVQAQSHQNFEIIMIDDGSTDSSAQICNNLAEKDPRIKLISTDHGGVCTARNAGLENAGGEFVFFLDSDDIIHPLLLETLVKALNSSDAKIAGTRILNIPQRVWSKAYEIMEREQEQGDTTYNTHEDTLHAIFRSETPLNLIGGVMMRRDYIGDTRFSHEIYIGEDFYFCYQNLIKGSSVIFLKQRWYYCRLHDGNSSHDRGYNGFLTRFRRRELVWQSEEAFGRTENANLQKLDAFGCYLGCIRNINPHSEDGKKICRYMKDNKSKLLPSFNTINKLKFYIYVYFPGFYIFTARLKAKLKARLIKWGILKRR